ncbi:MAG: hypothetical protein ACXWM6_16205, partial [Thermodesulfobacteriota bacterium]
GKEEDHLFGLDNLHSRCTRQREVDLTMSNKSSFDFGVYAILRRCGISATPFVPYTIARIV